MLLTSKDFIYMNDWAGEQLKMNEATVTITLQRYEELQMLVNRNFILEAKVKAVSKELLETQVIKVNHIMHHNI